MSNQRELADRRTQESPAVGVVDTGEADAVAGTVLRARDRGHHAFVLTEAASDAARFARELGADVVTPEESPGEGGRTNGLQRTARQAGFPGVIYHEDPTRRIDYERTVSALWDSDEYVIESHVKSVVSADSGVLVAIPAYNEAGTIGDVVRNVSKRADHVLVVDDGSDDDTASIARKAGATVVEHGYNRGYGGALKTAFREANRCGADHLVIVDGDGQHDASDITRLVDRQRESGAQVVIGSRFHGAGGTDLPLYRRVGVEVVNTLTNASLDSFEGDQRVRDTQCGFRCYDREAIESLAVDYSISNHMGASTDILHHACSRGYDIEEVGTTVDYDVENASTQSPIRHGLTLVSNILSTVETEHPVLILGAPGFVLSFAGVGVGYLTFSNYLATNTFPHGLAIVSVFLTLVGLFAGFTAIILHALHRQLEE
jgi:glycosyltransferase involved in cell wall biosynthesis